MLITVPYGAFVAGYILPCVILDLHAYCRGVDSAFRGDTVGVGCFALCDAAVLEFIPKQLAASKLYHHCVTEILLFSFMLLLFSVDLKKLVNC